VADVVPSEGRFETASVERWLAGWLNGELAKREKKKTKITKTVNNLRSAKT